MKGLVMGPVSENFAIMEFYCGKSGKIGFYNNQELGLAKALARQQYKVFIVYPSMDSKSIIEELVSINITILRVPAIRVGVHSFYKLDFLLKYNICIAQLGSDNQLFAPTVMNYCERHHIRFYNYVGTIYSDTTNKFKLFITNLISRRNIIYFRKFPTIAKTPFMQELLNSAGVKDIEVIPVGLDTEIIPCINDTKLAIRKKLGLPTSRRILLFVGRLEPYKCPLDIVELMKHLKDDSYMVIIGTGQLKSSLLKKLEQSSLLSNIKYIESVPNEEIHYYYRAADFFINFNKNEIFGMSILEAMYQGCNVIARHAPGPDYIIEDGVSGWLFQDTAQIVNLIKNSTNDCSAAAVLRIKNIFNWNSSAQKFLEKLDR